MKLFRNDALVAEGKATRDPDSDVVAFDVDTWHVKDKDTDPWLRAKEATWTIEDGERRTDYAGRTLGVGSYRDEVRTLDIDATDPLGDHVNIDVR